MSATPLWSGARPTIRAPATPGDKSAHGKRHDAIPDVTPTPTSCPSFGSRSQRRRLRSRKPSSGLQRRGEAVRDLAPQWDWRSTDSGRQDPGSARPSKSGASAGDAHGEDCLCSIRRPFNQAVSADRAPLSRRRRAEDLDVEVADLLAQRIAVEAQKNRRVYRATSRWDGLLARHECGMPGTYHTSDLL